MKISGFAKRFGIGINTVRYYVNCGLLLPEVHNKQFRFNEKCAEDMKLILLLKQFDFSIAEIQSTLSLMRLSNLTAKDDVADFINILENKKGVLRAESLRYEQAAEELGKYIATVREQYDRPAALPRKMGVPIEMLQYLCCPHCGASLSLKEADLVSGQIMRADVSCPCGYKASIKNGIFVTEGRSISELDSPDLDRKFYKDLPVSWVTLFQRSFNWMLGQMSRMDLSGKVVLENHINCYFFLFSRLDKIDRNAYYIISDKYPEIVALFKGLIEQQNPDLKILFLADSSFRYPIKKGCVDLYIDYCSINEYAVFNPEGSLLDIVLPHLHENSEVLGTYFYFEPASASHRKLLQLYPTCAPQNYLMGFFRSIVKKAKLQYAAEENIGSVTDWGGANRNFLFHVANDPMTLHSYRCRL